MKTTKAENVSRGQVILALAALLLVLLPFAHMIRRDADTERKMPPVVLDLGQSRSQALAIAGAGGTR